MADIFISYTSSDREWAFWVGHELEALGHTPRIHEWDIPAGGDIAAWMEARHDALAEALFHLDPETPNEVLSLALVLAHQLDLLLCNFTNHSTCIKARRAGDAVERAYQAILRGLIRHAGLTSPLLLSCNTFTRVSSVMT